jgi:thiol-disulfide isomerase/thioredoxin
MKPAKRRWTTWVLQLAAVVLFFLLLNAWNTRDAPTGPAPEISGQLLDGSPVSLEALRGKPVLVHFWATWCPVCSVGQSAIDAIAKDHTVLSVAMDEATPAQILAYMKDRDVDYPVIHDPDYTIARRYAIRGVPSSFILDAMGNIRFVETGYTTNPGLRLRLWWAGRYNRSR